MTNNNNSQSAGPEDNIGTSTWPLNSNSKNATEKEKKKEKNQRKQKITKDEK